MRTSLAGCKEMTKNCEEVRTWEAAEDSLDKKERERAEQCRSSWRTLQPRTVEVDSGTLTCQKKSVSSWDVSRLELLRRGPNWPQISEAV